ncbi:hypothetical protein ACP4OV_007963 [Aristida adscensionis]
MPSGLTDGYEKYHDLHGGEEESRKSNYSDLANKYYDLVTSFYEYGWGNSFHFAGRRHGETLCESIRQHEHYIAGTQEGDEEVLDVGCGIGGPLLEIASFSSALITGLNNNGYQISRGKELISSAGLSEQCNFVKGDFMNMPIPDNTFDAAYAIQATCHAPDASGVYSEVYRVLKPGQYFALDEWCMTDRFDPNDAKHRAIKAEIKLGDGVIFAKDLAEEFPCPWYQPMDPSQFSWTSFRCTGIGRFITRVFVSTMECLHIAPSGSMEVCNILETASKGLLKGGREGIFTANFFVLGQKPVTGKRIVDSHI